MKASKLVGPLMIGCVLALPVAAADGGKSPPISNNPDVPSCKKVTQDEIGRFVGPPARVRDSSVNDKRLGFCVWVGSKPDVIARVTFLPAPSMGVPPGQERAYFDQVMLGRKEQNKPGEFVEVSGPWESAWAQKLSENNDERFFQIFLLKNGDWANIETFAMPFDSTLDIAKLAASRM